MYSATSSTPPPPYGVLIADDSAVARAYIAKIIEQDSLFTLRGSAANGEIAIKALQASTPEHSIDVIILDTEMPLMDGLEALPKLLAILPEVSIIMMSAISTAHNDLSLNALNHGASDFITKPSNGTGFSNAAKFQQDLLKKMRALVRTQKQPSTQKSPDLANFVARSSSLPPIRRPPPVIVHGNNATASDSLPLKEKPATTIIPTAPSPSPIKRNNTRLTNPPEQQPAAYPSTSTPSIVPSTNKPASFKNRPAVFAIGCSTGGPQALITLLKELTPLQHMPTFITQHMPPTFTKIFAEQITTQTSWTCVEAENGMIVENGKAYLAAGDYHLLLEKQRGNTRILLSQDPPENFCRPAVDPMMRSLIRTFGACNVVALILTGMGQDGLAGCQQIVEGGGVTLAQDEKTSVVWGMPGAVAKAGICQAVLPLKEIAPYINQAMGEHYSR
jgi:two-component system chemotaxis response regulator CheB